MRTVCDRFYRAAIAYFEEADIRIKTSRFVHKENVTEHKEKRNLSEIGTQHNIRRIFAVMRLFGDIARSSLRMNKRISTSIIALLAVPGAASAAIFLAESAARAAAADLLVGRPLSGNQVGHGLNTVSQQATNLFPGYAGLRNPVSDSQNYSSRGPLTGFQSGTISNMVRKNLVLGVKATWTTRAIIPARRSSTTWAWRRRSRRKPTLQDNFRWSVRGRAEATPTTAHSIMLRAAWWNGGYNVQQNYWTLAGVTPFNPGTMTTRALRVVNTSNFNNSGSYNIERFGWTVGAGIEYAFTDTWSANLEYRHSDFGTAVVNSVQVPGLTLRDSGLTDDSVRLASAIIRRLPLFVTSMPSATVEAPKGPTAPKVAAAPPPPPAPTFLGRLYHAYADEWGLDSPTATHRAAQPPRLFPAGAGRSRLIPSPNIPSAAPRPSARPCRMRSTRR